MRSSLPWANHSSPWRVTHTEVAASAGRPALSCVRAISSTSPALSSRAVQLSRPCASVLPLHSVPSSRVCTRLS
jgi:hypothetical protein